MKMDKLLHFSVCFIATITLGLIPFVGVVAGALFALGLAIGKEVGDYFNPNSSGYCGDLIADIVGIIAGVLIIIIL